MRVYKCNCNLRTCKTCGPRIRYHEKKAEKAGLPVPVIEAPKIVRNSIHPENVEVRDHTGLGLDVLLSKEGRCLVLSIRSPEREIGIQRISMTRINSPSHNSGGRA